MDPTELTAELGRLRQMIDAVRKALCPSDIHAVTLLADIAERIAVLSLAADSIHGGVEVPRPSEEN